MIILLLVSPYEHTTDPENMVYTWFDNYIFLLLIIAQANPISYATDPENMTCYCR